MTSPLESSTDTPSRETTGDLGQLLLEVATTLRHSRLPSAQHPVCSTKRSAAVATVTELCLGYVRPESGVAAAVKQAPRELPCHLLCSEHLRVLSVSWERLQQLAAKQHEGQCLVALFAPRLQQLVVGGNPLADSGAHLAQLLWSAGNLETIKLQSRGTALLSGRAHQAPPVLKHLRSVEITRLQLCAYTVVPWLRQHKQQ